MIQTMPTREEAIALVKGALKKQRQRHPGFKSKIHVYEPSVRSKDDWWYVGVYPSSELKTIYYYYDILAQAEEELQDKKNLKILLIPVRPQN